MRELRLHDSTITSLPPSIGRLKNFEVLKLYETWLRKLPEEIGDLSSLRKLDLNWSRKTSLPPSVGRLKNLGSLSIVETNITHLPEGVGELVEEIALVVLVIGPPRFAFLITVHEGRTKVSTALLLV